MNPRFPHDDPDAPATPEELAAAEELRLALDDPKRDNDEAALLRAAALAHAPRPIDDAEHRAMIDATLSRAATETAARRSGRRTGGRGVVVRVAFGAAASAIAIAAGFALFVTTSEQAPAPRAHVALVHVRSTQPLFDAPFAAQGGTTARIDRIAIAREDDLRENRFSRWGVH